MFPLELGPHFGRAARPTCHRLAFLQDALAEERAHMESLQAQQEQIEQLRKCHPWVNVGTVVVSLVHLSSEYCIFNWSQIDQIGSTQRMFGSVILLLLAERHIESLHMEKQSLQQQQEAWLNKMFDSWAPIPDEKGQTITRCVIPT